MEEFHRADWPGKAALIRSFEDERLQQLAQRIVYASASDALSEADRKRMADAIAGRLHDDHADPDLWRTIPQAIAADIQSWLIGIASKYPAAIESD